MWQEKVYFQNKRGEMLSGILEYPEESPTQSILLLGPHPHLGGDIHNNVLQAIVKKLENTFSLILRFDYHGTGESQAILEPGVTLYDHYEALEQKKDTGLFLEDSLCAWDYLSNIIPSKIPNIIIGYSLGGYIAFSLIKERKADLILVLAPPLCKYPPVECQQKVFCLQAEKDFLKSEIIPTNVMAETLEGSDHFFRTQEQKVSQWVWEKIFKKTER